MTLLNPNNLLALDTSTRVVGLAVYDGNQVIGELSWMTRDYHTVELAPAVAELLTKTKTRISEIGALGVAMGPGSFTGLRIGLALAKGLALARNLPIIGIPTLDILAASQPTSGHAIAHVPLAAVLLAGRSRLAVGWYLPVDGTWRQTGQIEILTTQELSDRIQTPTLICGELTGDERRMLSRKRKNVILASPAHSLRRPSFLAELAWQRWQAGQVDDPATLSPIYLHYNEPIPG